MSNGYASPMFVQTFVNLNDKYNLDKRMPFTIGCSVLDRDIRSVKVRTSKHENSSHELKGLAL